MSVLNKMTTVLGLAGGVALSSHLVELSNSSQVNDVASIVATINSDLAFEVRDKLDEKSGFFVDMESELVKFLDSKGIDEETIQSIRDNPRMPLPAYLVNLFLTFLGIAVSVVSARVSILGLASLIEGHILKKISNGEELDNLFLSHLVKTYFFHFGEKLPPEIVLNYLKKFNAFTYPLSGELVLRLMCVRGAHEWLIQNKIYADEVRIVLLDLKDILLEVLEEKKHKS